MGAFMLNAVIKKMGWKERTVAHPVRQRRNREKTGRNSTVARLVSFLPKPFIPLRKQIVYGQMGQFRAGSHQSLQIFLATMINQGITFLAAYSCNSTR